MKTSFAVAMLFAASGLAYPANTVTVDGITVDESSIPIAAPNESPAEAAANWMKDTGIVSNFLNIAATLKGADYTRNAQLALDAEKNELTHKAILDKVPSITGTQTIQNANNSLATEGHFQAVVTALQDMVNKGPSIAVADTIAINSNRCVYVLPAIDAYVQAGAPGAGFLAIRPTVCDSTGVKPDQAGYPAAGVTLPAGSPPVAAPAPQGQGNSQQGQQGQQGQGHHGHHHHGQN